MAGWLLERRRRAEQALISVVATSYLLGVSTRRVDKLAETLGITSLSKSQVSELAKSLDGAVEEFRSRPLDGGPPDGQLGAAQGLARRFPGVKQPSRPSPHRGHVHP